MLTILKAFGISCFIAAMIEAAIFILMIFWLIFLDSSFKRIITGAFLVDWIACLVDWIESMWDALTFKRCIALIVGGGWIVLHHPSHGFNEES